AAQRARRIRQHVRRWRDCLPGPGGVEVGGRVAGHAYDLSHVVAPSCCCRSTARAWRAISMSSRAVITTVRTVVADAELSAVACAALLLSSSIATPRKASP